MNQIDTPAERSALSPAGMNSRSEASLRDRITATIIREEAAESFLASIRNDAELVALQEVLNRYSAFWWIQHLSKVGADPVGYWRQQLGAEIEAATKGRTNTARRKKCSWWFFRRSATSAVTYELFHLDLTPLYESR
jgi:hypothetical protein